MERTIENLKEMIRAGRGIIPADIAIRGGLLVNVMTSEKMCIRDSPYPAPGSECSLFLHFWLKLRLPVPQALLR